MKLRTTREDSEDLLPTERFHGTAEQGWMQSLAETTAQGQHSIAEAKHVCH